MRTVRVDGVDYECYSFVQWIMKVVADPWKNYLLPASLLRRVTRLSRSPLIEESHRSPGSWKSMEIIYQNRAPVDLLDKIALRDNPISMAARNRRRYVVAELTRLMLHYAKSGTVNILGVGAGPGLQVQDAFTKSGLSPQQVDAVFIDRDDAAFEYGTARAKAAGFLQSIRFIAGDARDVRCLVPDGRFHIVKLIGIIEYLTDEAVVELCSAVHKVMDSNGTLLTHGIQDRHHAMPFLERVFQLKHQQRSGEEVCALLSAAGFRDLTITPLPMRIYAMVAGRRSCLKWMAAGVPEAA